MKINVKPARPGLVVRDPRSKRPLPENGGMVPDNSFWRRRLRSGDVIPVDVVEGDTVGDIARRIETNAPAILPENG